MTYTRTAIPYHRTRIGAHEMKGTQFIGYLVHFYDPNTGKDRTTLHNGLREACEERDRLTNSGFPGVHGEPFISVTRIEYSGETKVYRNGHARKD